MKQTQSGVGQKAKDSYQFTLPHSLRLLGFCSGAHI